jgi:putative ABC transport system ATP-binding protein
MNQDRLATRDGVAGTLIDLQQVSKTYHAASGPFAALRNVTLQVRHGQMIAVTGKSGSGKSTLLNILSGIDHASSGTVSIAGASPLNMAENQLALWRGKTIGVVFQFFQLLPTLTVLENVMLPMEFCNTFPAKERVSRALALLERVGIRDQAGKLPVTLSGGQQQRAAIARALANDPLVIVADEPTGNLDSHTARSIFQLFKRLAAGGKTIVIVTHETEFSDMFETTVTLEDGQIVGIENTVSETREEVEA